MTTESPAGPPGTEWVTPPSEDLPQPKARHRWGRAAIGAGLVVAGLGAGIGIGYAVNADSSGHGRAGAAQAGANQQAADGGQGAVPGGQGDAPGAGPGAGPGGGQPGEQHVQGTLTAVGTSAVTVKSASGTATYKVTTSTQILRNGSSATLSQLKAGDPVLVHVLAGGTAERVLAGTPPNGSR